ncbi:hypothetical protein BGZ58_001659 [Dissophora ornata]|nr:hypothetical protein BGZ58_001659 [Dissophora ornata]
MGFLFGFLCGLLVIPLSISAALYFFFTYSESFSEKRQELLQEEKRKEKEEIGLDLEDMPSALYASYLSARQQAGVGSNGLPAVGSIPEHLDPQYQFAGWISVKRIPEVDHRIIEPSIKESKKNKNGEKNTHKGSQSGMMDERQGRGVAGSFGSLGAAQDPRSYLDTQNLHLALPPCLQARFKDSKYGVIKGAAMFIYENEYMNDCLGVITLPNYQVSVPGNQTDSHIFSKRNPIWLKFQPNSSRARRSTAGSEGSSPSEKDYYLSMVNCVDKEDLYFTLLRCSKLKPNSRSFVREIPKRDSTLFDKSAMNTLIRSIHSNEHQFQAAWLNAMLGRMFLGVYKTPQVKDMVFQKLVDKLSRVRLPNFLNDMRMKSVHLGDGVPMITRPKLLSLKPNGDMIMDMDLLYQGGFRAEVEAEAVVTVTKKIQPIKVSLVLVMTLVRLEGRVQAWIKPPPCNRIWYGFYHKPQVEMKIEPVVSDKHIKSNLIIKAIENKMLEAIAETMVLPNMDDIPFSDSEGVGGIFGEEILPGGETAATPTDQHHERKVFHPIRSHNQATRSATIDVTESGHSTPRSAIELPSDLRHRTETMSVPELYHHGGAAKSHPSLGDEVMQANYSFDSNKRAPSPPGFDDIMQSGIQRSGLPSESLDRTIPRTLNVPGGRGIKVGADQPPRPPSPESILSSSSSSKLLNRRNPGQTMEPVRGRSGSFDGNMLSAKSTGSSFGSAPNTAPIPAMDAVRTTDENWSQYGICEYEPSILEGGKVINKDKKKMKEKIKNAEKERMCIESDRVSVHSKESGDNVSTYTGNTDTTGQSSTLYGSTNGSHSTVESSSKSEKFSLSKMFQGFRKKHTKGVHSGSSLQLSGNVINDGQDANSVIMEDDESLDPDTERTPSHGPLDTEDQQTHGLPSSEQLSSSYQLLHREKLGSTPNLSLAMDGGEPVESSASVSLNGTDSLYSPQEGNEYLMKRTGSPVSSVYAASLFGVDEQPSHNNGTSNSKAPSPTHNQSLMNFSPKFGTALRKLRNRSRGGSGSSKEELSIPPGDLNAALKQHLQQPPGIPESENSSQISQQPEGYGNSSQGYNDDTGVNPQRPGELLPNSSSSSSLEEEQFPGEWSESFNSASRSASATPVIVLQKPSPHLGHTEPSTEGTFVSERYNGRVSMDDSRLQQYGTNSDSRGRSPGPVTNGKLGSVTTKPRRHSINHPPSISPATFASHHFLTHGLGVTPASPLRNQFALEDDEKNSTLMLSEDESTIDEQSQTNSDTYSAASTTNPSSPKDTQLHHSSTFRNILSTLSGRHKKRANTSPQSYGNNQESYSAIGAVGMAGAMVISRAIVARSSSEDDPFAQVGGADEHKGPLRVSQESSRQSSESTKSVVPSATMIIEERKMRHGLGPLLESPAIPPTQSIMGKAIALDFDHRKEVLHARPGYIGEYPTPIRMHSMLNRESVAVRSLIDRDEDDVGLRKYHETIAREDSPSLDVGLSPTLPLDSAVSSCKSYTMPLPKMDTTLHEPLPASIIDEEIPEGMPVNTCIREASKEEALTNDAGHLVHHSSDPFVNEVQELSEKHIGDCNQTMTRCEYDVMVRNRQPPTEPTSPTPCVGEPVEDEQQQQQQEYQECSLNGSYQQQQVVFQVVEVTKESQFLQPSSPTPPNSVPEIKKGHHRNIFKRLIRRNSEEGLFSHHSKHTPQKSSPSSLYMNPGSSKSQSSILTTSSSSSSGFSVPFLHFHKHHKQQQQQQQMQPLQQLQEHQVQEEKASFDSSDPREFVYEERTSTQIPDHNRDVVKGKTELSKQQMLAEPSMLEGLGNVQD